MSTCSGASKGKSPAPTQERSESSDLEDQLDVKAQIMALQQAQVKQAVAAQTAHVSAREDINTLSISM